MSDDLDKILEELKNDDSITSLNQSVSTEKLNVNDENINDYIIQRVGRLIESGIETVETIQQTRASGFEAEELQAFSGLISSVVNAAETLNKINIQNKKAKASKELKEMELEAKRQFLPSIKGGNTNVLIATREEVLERFLDKNKKYLESTKFTEAESEDINDD